MSDHFPIILSLNINKSNRLNIINTYNTKHNLINDVTVYHFSNFLNCQLEFLKTDNSETWNLFIDFCIHKFNIYCPVYENRKYKKKFIPWNTKRNLKKCRIKQKLYKKYKLTNNENDLLKLQIVYNSLTTLIRKTKRSNYSDTLHNCSDSKNTWDIFNNVMNKKNPNPLPDTFKSCGIEITDPSIIYNTFNIFFRDIGIELDEKY